MEVLVLRGHRDRVVRDRLEGPTGICTELDPLDHGRPVAEPVHLLSSQHDPHRAFQRARRERGQHDLILRAQARAEPTTHVGRQDAHLVRLQLEHAADIALNVLHTLRLVENRELAPSFEIAVEA